MKCYTAFIGDKFTIEWYVDQTGYSQPYEYFSKSSKLQQDKLFMLFKLMGTKGKIFDITKFRNEVDGIYAFKPNQDRYLCCFAKGRKIIVTNGFIKKSQKLPPREKEKAIAAYNDYIRRVHEGTYYEEEH